MKIMRVRQRREQRTFKKTLLMAGMTLIKKELIRIGNCT
jgi:hypothetical protein